jgi:ABC-type maltose transport system permease subunit
MKTTSSVLTALTLVLASSPCAFASSTTKVYNSGILVLAFLGFCALVVVIQLIPAMITLYGMLKELTKKNAVRATSRS